MCHAFPSDPFGTGRTHLVRDGFFGFGILLILEMGLEVLQCVHVQLQSFVVVAGIVFFHGLFHVFDGLFLEIRVHGVSLSAGGRPKDRFGGDTIAPARKQSTCEALVATSSPLVFHVEVDVGARAGFFRVRKGRLDRTFFSKGPFYFQDRRGGGVSRSTVVRSVRGILMVDERDTKSHGRCNVRVDEGAKTQEKTRYHACRSKGHGTTDARRVDGTTESRASIECAHGRWTQEQHT